MKKETERARQIRNVEIQKHSKVEEVERKTNMEKERLI